MVLNKYEERLDNLKEMLNTYEKKEIGNKTRANARKILEGGRKHGYITQAENARELFGEELVATHKATMEGNYSQAIKYLINVRSILEERDPTDNVDNPKDYEKAGRRAMSLAEKIKESIDSNSQDYSKEELSRGFNKAVEVAEECKEKYEEYKTLSELDKI